MFGGDCNYCSYCFHVVFHARPLGSRSSSLEKDYLHLPYLIPAILGLRELHLGQHGDSVASSKKRGNFDF